MRENAARKASRYLIEGRLIVTQVQPGLVRSVTRGDGHVWHQAWDGTAWVCDCPAVTDQCSHLIALRRVVAIDLGRNAP